MKFFVVLQQYHVFAFQRIQTLQSGKTMEDFSTSLIIHVMLDL